MNIELSVDLRSGGGGGGGGRFSIVRFRLSTPSRANSHRSKTVVFKIKSIALPNKISARPTGEIASNFVQGVFVSVEIYILLRVFDIMTTAKDNEG